MEWDSLLVEIARPEAHFDARRLAFDGEHRRPGHRRGERLRELHASTVAPRAAADGVDGPDVPGEDGLEDGDG